MTQLRLASLDAFRGFAIAAMVLVNNPGTWDHVYPPLDHSAWNGCTFTDLIFPCFLFASGLAMTLSLGTRAREGADNRRLLRSILRRATLLFLIGLALNLIPAFNLATLRLPGVLQRIALVTLLGSPVVLWGGWRASLGAILGCFAVYLVLMLKVPVLGADGLTAAGRLQPGLDFGAWLDRLLLSGHLYARARTWDPEGLLGTLPALGTFWFGSLSARFLLAPAGRLSKALGLLLAGLASLGLGSALEALGCPINKSLWTPAFALFTAGWALVFLAVFHALLDEAPEPLRTWARRLCLPLTIYGMNALFLFVLSGLLARLLLAVHVAGPVTLGAWAYGCVAALPLAPVQASLAFAILFELAMFAVAWALWRRRWFFKV